MSASINAHCGEQTLVPYQGLAVDNNTDQFLFSYVKQRSS